MSDFPRTPMPVAGEGGAKHRMRAPLEYDSVLKIV